MKSKITRLSCLTKSDCKDFGEQVSLCFGHFGAIHPGHLRYFRMAKEKGNRLVVALEGDSQLTKQEQALLFLEVERAQAVAALDIVDSVVILDSGRLEDLVQLIQPASLILGKEFESIRASKVTLAVKLVVQLGGEVLFDSGETHYATSSYLYESQTSLEREKWGQFRSALNANNIDFASILNNLSDSASPRILVVGDTIIDRYVACDPIGMSNEAPVIVVKEIQSKDYIGGAAIVAAHVAALGGESVFLSVIGRDDHAEYAKMALSNYQVAVKLFEDVSRPTTFKIRYMVDNQKLFRVSRLKEHSLSRPIEDQVIGHIQEVGPSLDGIVVSDFVYGMITDRVVQTLREVAHRYGIPLFGDLQCSSQVGNITKFQQFSLLFPTEREARIALGNQDDGVEYVANLLMNGTDSKNLIMKLGADGFIAYMREQSGNIVRKQHFPALSVRPLDVAGAGDSLLAAISVAMMSGMSLMEACSIGCCVSALAVENVGNNPVNLGKVRQYFDERFV